MSAYPAITPRSQTSGPTPRSNSIQCPGSPYTPHRRASDPCAFDDLSSRTPRRTASKTICSDLKETIVTKALIAERDHCIECLSRLEARAAGDSGHSSCPPTQKDIIKAFDETEELICRALELGCTRCVPDAMHVFEESVAMVDRLSDLLRAQDHCKTDGKEDKGAGTNYSDTAKTPIPIKSDHYQSYSQTFAETTYVASSADSEDESDLESGFGDLSSSSEEDDREREDMVEKVGSDAFGAAVPQQTLYGRRRHSCPEAIGAQKGSRPSIPMLPVAHSKMVSPPKSNTLALGRVFSLKAMECEPFHAVDVDTPARWTSLSEDETDWDPTRKAEHFKFTAADDETDLDSTRKAEQFEPTTADDETDLDSTRNALHFDLTAADVDETDLYSARKAEHLDRTAADDDDETDLYYHHGIWSGKYEVTMAPTKCTMVILHSGRRAEYFDLTVADDDATPALDEEFFKELSEAGLSCFVEPLASWGVENASDTAYLSDTELAEIGMLLVQRRKLRALTALTHGHEAEMGKQAGAIAGASTEDTDVEVNVGYINYFTSTQLLLF